MYAYLKRVPVSEIKLCQANADYAADYIMGVQPDTETQSLKQSWDGLHFLLSPSRRKPSSVWDTSIVWNSTDLMGIAVIGKATLNDTCKIGFVAPKWIPPDLVSQIAAGLKEMKWETLDDLYSPGGMKKCGVYPEELWDEEDEDRGRNYLRYWFIQLSRFYQMAASLNQAVICYLKLQT